MKITSLDKDEQEFYKSKYGLTHEQLFEACKFATRTGVSFVKAAKIILGWNFQNSGFPRVGKKK